LGNEGFSPQSSGRFPAAALSMNPLARRAGKPEP